MFDKLQKDQIVTVIGISDWMGMTTKTVAKAVGTQTSHGAEIFRMNEKGARSKFTLTSLDKNDKLVFLGEVPFKIDSDVTTQREGSPFTSRISRGNACLNLVGDPETIKDWILNKNLNKNFTRLDSVILIDGEKEIPLFPEVETSHAVVLGIRAKQ